MSVVNKMLQDLEARNSGSEIISTDYLAPSKSNAKIWASLGIILVLALAAYFWLMGPQWTSDNKGSTKIVDVKNNPTQDNLQSMPKDNEDKMLVENNASTVEVDLPSANTVKTNQLQKSKITSSVESAKSMPSTSHDTSEIGSVTESRPPNGVAIVAAQSSAQTVPVQDMHQSPVLSKVIDGVRDKKPTKAESHFSISDSSEKNKLAGAKQSVISALSEGDNELAIRRLEELLGAQPSNIEARKKLAALLFAQKRSKQAERVLLQGIKNHPLRSDLRLMMARLYMQKKDDEAAIQILTDVQPDATNKLEFLAYRAALLQQNAHYEQAKDDYVQLLEADAWNAKWWLGLAITQDRLGQSGEALSAYRTAYDKDKLSPSVVKFVEQRMIQLEGAQ